MIIGGFNGLIDDLVIENYPNLEKIIVKNHSLKNLNSLKICNNENLKTIEIDDGKETQDGMGRVVDSGSFRNVENVILESTWLNDYLSIQIFLIYNHLKQEIIHSVELQGYLYQVTL